MWRYLFYLINTCRAKILRDDCTPGLGDVSETCLESSHKVLRYASKHLARQHNNLINAYDCFNHLWLYSDPFVRAELESNSTSTSTKVVKDRDDALVESFFEDWINF